MNKNEFSLLFEDDNLRVFYKPSGLHSVSVKNSEESAVNEYKRKYGDCKDIDGDECGLLYRLDCKTSGLLAFAKNNEVYKTLFRSGLTKTYIATSHATFTPLQGIYDKDGYENLKQKLDEEKKLTFTSYFRGFEANSAFVRPVLAEHIAHFKDKKVNDTLYTTEIKKLANSKFECKIQRGFRHQIRATLASLFYPIDGDINYGSKVILEDNSIALVCQKLEGEYCGIKYKLDLDKL